MLIPPNLFFNSCYYFNYKNPICSINRPRPISARVWLHLADFRGQTSMDAWFSKGSKTALSPHLKPMTGFEQQAEQNRDQLQASVMTVSGHKLPP